MEWSPDFETAFVNTRFLNDKYQLDGFDPSGFGGIALCYGKCSTRSHIDRDIFGFIPTIEEEDIRIL